MQREEERERKGLGEGGKKYDSRDCKEGFAVNTHRVMCQMGVTVVAVVSEVREEHRM